MSKVKFIKSISEMTKEMAEKIKDKKIIMKSKDPQIQKALDKKVDELTGMKAAKNTILAPKTQLRNKTSIKPKKMNGGGLATKGLGKAFLNSKR